MNHRPYRMKVSIGTGWWPIRGSSPAAAQKSARLLPGCGAAMLDADGVDFRNIPTGIFSRQLSIGSPNVRTDSPAAARWAAVDRP